MGKRALLKTNDRDVRDESFLDFLSMANSSAPVESLNSTSNHRYTPVAKHYSTV